MKYLTVLIQPKFLLSKLPFGVCPSILPGTLPGHLLSHSRVRIRHGGLRLFTAAAALTKATGLQAVPAVRFETPVIQEDAPTAAYVHLPFCRRKCFYCDFPVLPVGNRVSSRHVVDRMESYVRVLIKEIRAAGGKSRRAFGSSQGQGLQTVFFGGGTPSLIVPELFTSILEAIHEEFGILENAEISMEMDPGTFDKARLEDFVGRGVNRVSVGVQAFQGDLLKSCGRAHGLAEIYEAVGAIHDVGVTNWSLDLISSLPGQTLAMWQHSLHEAIAAGPAHVSVYDLQIEEGTPFGRWFQPGQQPLPSDDLAADMFREASAMLTSAGFEHYEISNYARPGARCRHNMTYWRNRAYHGFGLGAASYLGQQRFTRPRQLAAYEDWVAAHVAAQGDIDFPQDGDEELLLDAAMLGLRLADGLDLEQIRDLFGQEPARAMERGLKPFLKSGHASLIQRQVAAGDMNPIIRLTDPDGFLISNKIISDVFSELSGGSDQQSVDNSQGKQVLV